MAFGLRDNCCRHLIQARQSLHDFDVMAPAAGLALQFRQNFRIALRLLGVRDELPEVQT